ncbi:MAG: GntR family transcriptional regulator [Bacteroidia bacterium]|nr:GntR family transcriptional regulator [Bacteroidia bacterium]
MIKVGQYHTMIVLRETSVGLFLGNAQGDEILLPNKYIEEGTKVDDHIDVFVYKDSEDRPIATTLIPKAVAGQFAVLKVNDVSSVGAFLDMGLEKDLLVPYKEQNQNLIRGKEVLVYVYLDEVTNRMVASCKTHKFIEKETIELEEGEQVELLIGGQTDLGRHVIINNRYSGLIYDNEIFGKIRLGDTKTGYIKKLREDGKIDVSLQPQGYENMDSFETKVLEELDARGGELPIGDKSAPEDIYGLLGMSKKNFKKAIGSLYRQRLVVLAPTSVKKV